VLADLDALALESYVSPFQRAMILIGLREPQAALDELERAAESRSWYMTWLPSAPDLDALRSEPRFQALLARYQGR
jgi:hypothetical protein